MSGSRPEVADLVDDVMRRWPPTVRVFLRHRMACPGCAIGPFHTVADAAAEHGLAVEPLLHELRQAAGATPVADPLESPRASRQATPVEPKE